MIGRLVNTMGERDIAAGGEECCHVARRGWDSQACGVFVFQGCPIMVAFHIEITILSCVLPSCNIVN
jgi:hypothetical protein